MTLSRARAFGRRFGLIAALFASVPVPQTQAQTVLPDVRVIEKGQTEQYGGYVISDDFQVDPKISSVIFPTDALQADDVLSVQALRLAPDEYLVLQECASADCRVARLARVWGVGSDGYRMVIPHDGKYFLWMSRIEATSVSGVGSSYQEFQTSSAPLQLIPVGALAAYSGKQIEAAATSGPVRVVHSERVGAAFFATFDGGTVVKIKRMHAKS